MNDIHSTVDESLPHSVLERVDAICDRFEEAWLAGRRPRIEDYLADVRDERVRHALLKELIALDICHRQKRGETPHPHDYQLLSTVSVSDYLARRTATALPPERYQLGERIGAGGMGEVRKGCDQHLGRDLAIKVLRPEHHGDMLLQQRFLEEARIAGRLQHPGIVPVHDLGELSDGRPFFTMKLVQGRTLATLVVERTQPGQDLSLFLSIFEQICQTVAFAHAQGVIHRDLKPSNIMVGAFGEVQVMDWGLAKVLKVGSSEEAVRLETTLPYEPVEQDAAWQLRTQLGQVMGTYAYMPPEQARGELEHIDERSDVFGLGSILCEILTGQPPFSGSDSQILAQKAKVCDHAEALARLDACGADAELLRLAKSCLAAKPEDRPRNAGAVAEQMKAYLAGVQERMRSAERERAAAQARADEARKTAAAERRARQRMVGAAAALLLLIVGAGSGAWWYQWNQEQADGAVKQGLDTAERLLTEAQQTPLETGKFRQALEAARVASELARGASAPVRARAEELVKRLEQEREAAESDRQLLARLLEISGPRRVHTDLHDEKATLVVDIPAEEQFASAFRAWGMNVDSLPVEEAIQRIQARPAVVVTEIILALDAWASQRRRDGKAESAWRRIADVAAALDDRADSLANTLRPIVLRGKPAAEELLRQDRQRLRELAERIDPATESALGLLTLTRALLQVGESATAERLLRAALIERPQQVVFYHALGELLTEQKSPRWIEAVECYSSARCLRPDLGVRLAIALRNCGRATESLALLKSLLRDAPDDPYLLFHQANTLGELGKRAEAAAIYRKVIALKPKYAESYSNLGVALIQAGDLKEGEKAYRKAIALNPDLMEPYVNLAHLLNEQGKPVEAEALCRKAIASKPDFALAYNNLAFALNRQKKYAEAEAVSRKAIALMPDLVLSYNNLGIALSHQGKYAESEAAYRKAIPLKPDFAKTYNNLANTLNPQGKFAEAEAASRKALALKPDYVNAHGNLANALLGQRRLAEAEAACRKAIALKPDIADIYNVLGNILAAQRKYAEATAAYRKEIANHPGDHMVHYHLGNVLQAQKKPAEAAQAYRTAIALKPTYAPAHCNLGNSLMDLDQLAEAEAAYRKAFALDPKLTRAQYNLGIALEYQDKPAQAEKAYIKVLALEPQHAEAHCNLGNALKNQGRFAESLQEFHRGHELGSKQSTWRYPSEQWLRNAERFAELEPKLPAILQGREAPANPGEAVTLAWMCQKKKLPLASARLYADAFRADPQLAADLSARRRYSAAKSAALAAAGQGEDAARLPDKVAAMCRRWALGWLRDELKAYETLATQNNPATVRTILQRLKNCQHDPDLASLRDKDAVEKLPPAERDACRKLWNDVADLLQRARAK